MKNGNGANERGTGGEGAGVLDAERHVQAADAHEAGVQSVHALCAFCATRNAAAYRSSLRMKCP